MKYLTEQSLKEHLEINYPEFNWISNKQIPGSLRKFRPDFRSEEYKIIIEFDGYQHYTQSKNIINDNEKDMYHLTEFGYKTFRIPYYIQMCPELEAMIFSKTSGIIQSYPHGFIDDKCVLPSDFCYLGIERFISDMNTFEFAKSEIFDSLQHLIKVKNPFLVIPDLENFPIKIS